MSAPTRIGSAQLAALRSRLGDREQEVLHSLNRFRLLTTRQLERLHFANHRTPLTGARVCRRVLQRMHEQRLISRLERRIGGVRAGSGAYIYALGPIGHRLLHNHSRRRWREPSEVFVAHTIAVAQLAVDLLTLKPDQPVDLLELETEPSCWRQFTSAVGGVENLKPDLAIALADVETEWRWFVEIDLGTESGRAIVRKCRSYVRYWHSGSEQARHETFPKVLWIADTNRRAGLIDGAVGDASDLPTELFAVTTNEQALQLLTGSDS